jgi:gamma-glutamyltranspeptidase
MSPDNRADAAAQSNRPVTPGSRHACVVGNHAAAHAGLARLEVRGNAVDAGVAAGGFLRVS